MDGMAIHDAEGQIFTETLSIRRARTKISDAPLRKQSRKGPFWRLQGS